MVRIENLNKIFYPKTINENHAIKNINLKIEENDFITVIGSNGAGKSTLFNLISGNLEVSSGKIYIDNNDVTGEPEYKRSMYIGRIFQNPLIGTASNMTIEENMIIAHKKGFRGLKISLDNKIRQFFKEKLSLLNMNLENRLKDKVGLLSGGQRQALTLLMIVLSKPRLILLDEHTAALDPNNSAKIMDLTDFFIKEYKLTALMITHNMESAIKFGNKLIMMDQGEIILQHSYEEKKSLTVEKLINEFHKIKNKKLNSDQILLV